jgi:hypothetical protein
VKLTELNIISGHARLVVITSRNLLFGGRVACYIKDEGLDRPHNPYTEAFNDQSPLPVIVTPIYNPLSGTVKEWHIKHRPLSRDNSMLFTPDDDSDDSPPDDKKPTSL